jgi:hypothetical protein
MKFNLLTIKEKFISDPLIFIKEHIPLLILLPTILGGFWQLFELISIDISFVRFFSITQLIQDGILILCYLVFLAFFLFVVTFILMAFIGLFYTIFKKLIFKNINFLKSKFFDDGNFDIRSTSYITNIFYLINLCLPLILVFSYLPSFQIETSENRFVSNNFILRGVIISLLYISYNLFDEFFDADISEEKRFFTPRVKMFFLITSITFIFLSTMFFLKYASKPTNLKNYLYVENNQGINNKSENQTRIKYMNDKYLFVINSYKADDSTNSKIEYEVLKIDDLFQKDNNNQIEFENKILRDSVQKINYKLFEIENELDSIKNLNKIFNDNQKKLKSEKTKFISNPK